MWSGPRNISTAMMRAWENRPDTYVVDEPFYAHYLKETGIDHPGAANIIDAYETNWKKVAANVGGPIQPRYSIYFQKHMTLHMLDHIDLAWMDKVVNCFLIRNPSEVLTSYIKVRPDITIEDLGFPQQTRLYRYVRDVLGENPPVIDSRDVLENPESILSQLCDQIGIPFLDSMLSWPAGKRDSDGIWAPYWYSRVETSTGFAPYMPQNRPVPDRYADMLKACKEAYAELAQHKITP
ncbi:MAG: HAD family hydrolase [Chloroflexota bacterium]